MQTQVNLCESLQHILQMSSQGFQACSRPSVHLKTILIKHCIWSWSADLPDQKMQLCAPNIEV